MRTHLGRAENGVEISDRWQTDVEASKLLLGIKTAKEMTFQPRLRNRVNWQREEHT